MRRRIPRRMLAGAGVALLVAVTAGLTLAPDLSDASGAAPPTVLNRIAKKNDRAARDAAARMRAQSRAQAEQADALRAAEERGRVQAEAMLARFENSEAGRDDQAIVAQ